MSIVVISDGMTNDFFFLFVVSNFSIYTGYAFITGKKCYFKNGERCRCHIHYAAVLYIFFLEISYLCISVFVTLTHCYVRNVTGEIDQPLLRCCLISGNEWPKITLTIATGKLKSKLEGFSHSWIFPFWRALLFIHA